MNSKRFFSLLFIGTMIPCVALAVFNERKLVNSSVKATSYFNANTFQFPQDTDRVANTFPALMVQNRDGKSSPIQLSELKIDVEVIGNIATTNMEMLFYNDSSRVLEGELYFPLGEGQSISRFALDVDGKLREGVVVEKNKGQEVFEAVIREKIDPGLIEWTKGNNFKMRIYPIPSKGYKRVVVAYEQELSEIEYCHYYVLPLNFQQQIKKFDLKIEVFSQEIQPKVGDNSEFKLDFKKSENNYITSMSETNFLPNESLRIALPIPNNKEQIYTELVPGTTDKYYYYTKITPKKGRTTVKNPKTIGMIWDASNSMSARNLEREFELIDAYLKTNPNVTIKLITLRDKAEEKQSYTIANRNWTQLRTDLTAMKYDGASAYKSIDFTRFSCDAFMLFGDGLTTFGEKNGRLSKAPIYTVNSSTSANHAYLKYLAAASGGEYANLTLLEVADAVELLRGGGFQFFGTGVAQSYPSIPSSIQESIHVAGIISGKTDLVFSFGVGEATEKVNLTIDPALYLSSTGLIRRIWAQKKLGDLLINLDENEDAITALGKEHGIVTPTTSLIVLDRVEDYVTHEITPPKELRESYDKLLGAQKKSEKDAFDEHMKEVSRDFKEYVAWWNTDVNLAEILARDKQWKIDNKGRADSLVLNGAQNDAMMMESEEVGNASFGTVDAAFATDAMASPAPLAFSANSNESDPRKKDKVKDISNKGEIKLEKWEPDAPYMTPMKAANATTLYDVYLKLKTENASTPSFYLDAADVFIEKKQDELALRVLSNIAELELESHELMRVLAHRLEQLGYYDLAVSSYEEVLEIRKEEPQSYRDLGLCLEKAGRYQEAIDALYEVVENPWDGRFPGIETIVLAEINHIITLHKKDVKTSKIRSEFIVDLPVDVRVILNWDSDNCDMDLWVTDPRGEKCFYSHQETEIGGKISNDFTQGYGPEMFNLKRAMQGDYKVQVNYYGTSSQRLAGPTTIQLQLVTNYGKPNEKIKEVTRRLSSAQEILDIGSFTF
jgi:tetratricopeptide (TPR) repeat protein